MTLTGMTDMILLVRGGAGLNLSPAAIDIEFNAGDVRSLRTCKEHDGVGDVFALPKPFHRDTPQDHSRQFVHGFFGHAELPENRRGDWARAHRIHANSAPD